MSSDLLSGSVLVTGATGGIGHAIARAFAARGASLTLTGRRADVLEPLAAETRGRAVAVDLAERDAVQRLAEEAGEVDVLVANAALPASGELESYSVEQVDRALDVNLRAPIVLARLLLPGMLERGRGHLVFVSSLSGKSAQSRSSLYSATKFGMRGFALGIRTDLRGKGVGVTTIFPGFISGAGMFVESGAKLPRGVGTRTPEQVAAAVLRGIERNKAEIDVAPASMRLGAAFATLFPDVASRAGTKLGGDRLSADMAEAQRQQR